MADGGETLTHPDLRFDQEWLEAAGVAGGELLLAIPTAFACGAAVTACALEKRPPFHHIWLRCRRLL